MAKVINEYIEGALRYREWSDGHIEHNSASGTEEWLVSDKCDPGCPPTPGRSAGSPALSGFATYAPGEVVFYKPTPVDPNGLDAHAPGAKLDGGKVRWDLLDFDAIEGLAAVLTYGAEKYTENGWKEVPEAEKRYFSAMMRHYKAMLEGEDNDPESGLPHRYHFLTNAMFLCHFYGKDK